IDGIVQLLQAAGLIFRSDIKRRGKRQETHWDLTPAAEQLTAEAFVSTRSRQPGVGELPDWFDAPAKWRKGYLQRAIAQSPGAVLQQAVPRLSPRIDDPVLAESMIAALVRSNLADVAEGIFINWIVQEIPPASATSICRAASLLNGRSAVRSRLQLIAESHESLMVRGAALEALL
ncbi:MAG: hypothetical protein EBU49_11145, partial [Proteobacteria bacterium]|nr:hypothetical protein [Pseudomonadota bacterium]